jgi:hypothetical protein
MSDDMFIPILWMVHVVWFALWMLAIVVSTRILRRQLILALLAFLVVLVGFSATWAFAASHGFRDASLALPGFFFGALLGGGFLVQAGFAVLFIAFLSKKTTRPTTPT